MIVTESSFHGQVTINAIWQLQFGLLVGSIFVLCNWRIEKGGSEFARESFLLEAFIGYHTFMTCANGFKYSIRAVNENFNMALSFIGMMFSLWLVMIATSVLF